MLDSWKTLLFARFLSLGTLSLTCISLNHHIPLYVFLCGPKIRNKLLVSCNIVNSVSFIFFVCLFFFFFFFFFFLFCFVFFCHFFSIFDNILLSFQNIQSDMS